MVHHVTGLVGGIGFLARIAAAHDLKPPAALEFGDLGLLPIDEDNADRLPGVSLVGARHGDFEVLTPSLIDWIGGCSIGGDLCWVETLYTGGEGGQGALRFRDGALVFGPAWGEVGTINAALAGMGVPDGEPIDAFARVGLSAHRGNDGFRAARGEAQRCRVNGSEPCSAGRAVSARSFSRLRKKVAPRSGVG